MEKYKQQIIEQEVDGKLLKSFGKATLTVRDIGEEEAPLVPEDDPKFFFDATFMESLALGIQGGDNVLIVGPTGSGKTCGVEQLAHWINQPLVVQNLRGDIRSSAFLGQMRVVIDPETKKTVTRFSDGILPRAMANEWWLLLDELDAAPPAILFTLQRVLTHRQLILDEDNGRVVNAGDGFRIIATANTLGRGDESGLYTGTNTLNEAFLDRFGTVIEKGYLGSNESTNIPSDDAEVMVVAGKSGLGIEPAKKMVCVARLIRQAYESEHCYCTFSTRRLVAWAQKMVILNDVKRSAALAVLNKLSKDDRAFVSETIQRIFGGR
jgi:cobaltochelatase CobS